ncbi:MAG: helix-hairpin-helix domain-containing protein [Candidatus Moraniibacteriota bacterium]|nr:MAG: helix-hairpin-helix domain-containing protein [Candidatus Moranbacteria bacterium]
MKKIKKVSLLDIPGVGKSIAEDLCDLGIREPTDLRGQDPEVLYESLCRIRGARIDRCVLYVFRTAVFFASHTRHDPEKLKWWNWKD